MQAIGLFIFSDAPMARQGLKLLDRLEKRELLTIKESDFLTRTSSGELRLQGLDRQVAGSACGIGVMALVFGTAIGHPVSLLLAGITLGGIAGKRARTLLPAEDLRLLAQEIQPGQVALLVVLEHPVEERLLQPILELCERSLPAPLLNEVEGHVRAARRRTRAA